MKGILKIQRYKFFRRRGGELLAPSHKGNVHKKIYTIHRIFCQSISELISWASRTTKMPNCIISFSDKNRRRGSLGDTTTNVSFVLTFLTIAFVHCEGFKRLKVPGKYYSFRLHRSSFLTSCGCPFKKYSVGI